MKKILSGLMILILTALFAATYVSSRKTEEVFTARIDQLNQSYAGLLQLELLDYQRGLLVSEVKTQVNLRQGSLPLQHQIRHFPWKVRALTSVAADSAVTEGLSELLPLEQLQIQTDVGLDGSSQSRFVLTELNLSAAKTQLQLRGLRFDCDLDAELSGGKLNLQLDSLNVSESGAAEIAVADVQLNSQFAEQQGLPLGSGELQIGKISLQQQARPDFELNKLRYRASSSLENDQLISGLELQLVSLLLGGETFSDGHLQLQISGISAAAVRELRENARQLQAELKGQKVDPLVLQLQLIGFYSQLFEAGVTVSLPHLSLQADAGTLQGKGKLQIAELNLAEANMLALDKLNGEFLLAIDRPVFNAGFRMLNNLQRTGRVSNSAVLNEQAEQLAGGLIQKGFFSRQDGGYRLELLIEQGQAELNGNPFRL